MDSLALVEAFLVAGNSPSAEAAFPFRDRNQSVAGTSAFQSVEAVGRSDSDKSAASRSEAGSSGGSPSVEVAGIQ